MPSGGARARSGPPPDPDALRRDRKDDDAKWTDLPAEGRQGPAPDWPLSEPSVREWDLWEQLWQRPQAVMWEANGDHATVALYVRRHAEAESPEASASLTGVVMRMRDALGISAHGMQALRWRVVGGSQPAASKAPAARRKSGSSARDRFGVINGGAA